MENNIIDNFTKEYKNELSEIWANREISEKYLLKQCFKRPLIYKVTTKTRVCRLKENQQR